MLEILERYHKQTILALMGLVFACVSLLFYVRTQNIVLIKALSMHTFTYIAFVIWLVVSIYKDGIFKAVPHPVLMILSVILVYYAVVSSFFIVPIGQKFSASEEMSQFLAYFLIVFLIMKFLTTIKEFNIIAYLVITVTFLTSVYGAFQFHFHIDILEEILPRFKWGLSQIPFVSTFGNKNFFNGFLCITLPVTIGYFFVEKNIWLLLFLAIATALGLDCLLIGQTRGVWLATLVTYPLMLGLLVINRKNLTFTSAKLKKNIFRGLIVLVVVGMVFVSFMYSKKISEFANNIETKINSLTTFRYTTNMVRLRMWQGAMRMATEEKIFFGQGVGTFQMNFPYHRPDNYHRSGVSHNTRHSHCEYLELVSETGVIGLGLFLWLFVTIIWSFIHLMYRYKYHPYFAVIVSIFGGVLGGLIDNMTGVNLRWIATAMPFYYMSGLGLSLFFIQFPKNNYAVKIKPQAKNKNVRYPTRAWIVLALCIVFLGYYEKWAKRIWDADTSLLIGMSRIEENNKKQLEFGLRKCEEAYELNPTDLSSLYKGAFAYLKKGQYKDALKLYTYLTRMAPNYAQIHNNIAIINQVLRNMPVALREFERATTIENNVKNHRNLATHYLNMGKLGSALYHLKRILMIDVENSSDFRAQIKTPLRANWPDWALAYMLIGRVYIQQNNIEGAKIQMKNALKYAPFHSEIYLSLAQLYIREGNENEAETQLKLAIKYNPSNLQAYRFLANILQKKGNISETIALYRQMFRFIPDAHPDKLSALQKQMVNLVLKFVDDLVNKNKNPWNPVLFDTVGWAYFKLFDCQKAEYYVRQAIKIQPQFNEATKRLAMILSFCRLEKP